jgi:hypothetical protein
MRGALLRQPGKDIPIMIIAGQRIMVEGKEIRCPSAPLYYLKSFGTVIEMSQDHYAISNLFDHCVSNDRELWRLTEKGHWQLLRRSVAGKEHKA